MDTSDISQVEVWPDSGQVDLCDIAYIIGQGDISYTGQVDL